MYKIISLLSFLIRQFALPNPFVNIAGENYAELVNYIFGGIFIILAYIITGSWYVSKKEDRWVGSIGFFLNYVLLTFITLGVSYFIHNIYWLSGIIIFVVIILCIVESKLFGKRISF